MSNEFVFAINAQFDLEPMNNLSGGVTCEYLGVRMSARANAF